MMLAKQKLAGRASLGHRVVGPTRGANEMLLSQPRSAEQQDGKHSCTTQAGRINDAERQQTLKLRS